MADQVDLNVASKESVARDLTNRIAAQTFSDDEENYKEKYLNLYAECLKATKGNRNPSKVQIG